MFSTAKASPPSARRPPNRNIVTLQTRLDTLKRDGKVRQSNPEFQQLQEDIAQLSDTSRERVADLEGDNDDLAPNLRTARGRSSDFDAVYATRYANIWGLLLGAVGVAWIMLRTYSFGSGSTSSSSSSSVAAAAAAANMFRRPPR